MRSCAGQRSRFTYPGRATEFQGLASRMGQLEAFVEVPCIDRSAPCMLAARWAEFKGREEKDDTFRASRALNAHLAALFPDSLLRSRSENSRMHVGLLKWHTRTRVWEVSNIGCNWVRRFEFLSSFF